MPATVTLGARAVIHALLDAGHPLSTRGLAEAAGISPVSVSSTCSMARKALAGLDARIIASGPRDTPHYRIEGVDLARAREAAGAHVRLPSFMGFVGLRARLLQVIVGAGGRSVPLTELTRTLYGRDHRIERVRAVSTVNKIRATLERRGSEENVLSVGGAMAAVYAWGRALAPETEDIDPDAPAGTVITLPNVGGSYRYAAGRLQAPRFDWEVA